MDVKFSGDEIIEMAIQIEKKGAQFFDTIAHNSRHPKMKNILQYLAEQEREHIKIFEKLRAKENIVQNSESVNNWEQISPYFQSLIETKVFPDSTEGEDLLKELQDEIGAIHIAISFEKDNILFFQEIRNIVLEQEQKLLDQLILEEKDHIQKLVELKRSIIIK